MTSAITVVLYGYRLTNPDWRPPALAVPLREFVQSLADEFGKYGVVVTCLDAPDTILDVSGYADLLNTVRLRGADATLGTPCLGHIIGQSINRDLLEDLRRGVSRMAFAPEMIEPDGASKRTCHNCGCGC